MYIHQVVKEVLEASVKLHGKVILSPAFYLGCIKIDSGTIQKSLS